MCPPAIETVSSMPDGLFIDSAVLANGAEAATTEALVERAIGILVEVLKDNLCLVAFSGGKDSSGTLVLVLLALLRLRSTMPELPLLPVYVLFGDTEVENPFVMAEAMDALEELQDWARAAGLDVRVEIYRPRLADSYVVNVLSGAMLPSYANHKRRQCTHKLKLDPAQRATKRLSIALRSELEALAPTDPTAAARLSRLDRSPVPVVILGTRRQESGERRANMAARGEAADRITEFDGRRLLAPVADWTEDMIWELLALAGTTAGVYPVWRSDFRRNVAMYRASAGGECPVIAVAGRLGRTACSARMGCHTCQAVGNDRSLEALVMDPRYAALRPLLHIRNHIAAIRYDMDRRTWVTRQVHHDAASGRAWLKVQPHHFDSQTLQSIVGAYMTADRDEWNRAEAFQQALDEGRMPDDPYLRACAADGTDPDPVYLRRMGKPLFRVIDPAHAVGLDFYSGVLRTHAKPYTILELWHRVWHLGETITVPELDKTPPCPNPAPRWYELPAGGQPVDFAGLADPLVTMWDECWEEEDRHVVAGRTVTAVAADAFSVDPEAAVLILDLVYPTDWRERHQHGDPLWYDGVRSLVAMGTVMLSPAGRTHLHRIIQHRSAVVAAGCYDLSVAALYDRSADFGAGLPIGAKPETMPPPAVSRPVQLLLPL